MNRAIDVVKHVPCDFIVSSDIDWAANARYFGTEEGVEWGHWVLRPAVLAQDDTSMIDVVKHALGEIPGPPDQIILLVQPTQPLREPKHLQQAIALMETARYVVSVTAATSPDKLWRGVHGFMYPWDDTSTVERRQSARPAYRADGTVYAWRRKDDYWDWPFTPLIIPPEETCALDTPADWAEAERRLAARR